MKAGEKPRVIVIAGPTASGKTALSIKLAKAIDGEIISADSRQVYRGLNLGTGKVTKAEMEGVPHHLLDVADPMEQYTAADFVHDSQEAITDIHSRSKTPIIAGGTFFYVDALLGKVQLPKVEPNPELRSQLEKKDATALYEALYRIDEKRALSIDPQNKRRLIRALEIVAARGSVPQVPVELPYDSFIIAIEISKETLRENIHKRLHARIAEGMIKEVEELLERGVTHERLEELGLEYRYVALHLKGELGKEEMLEELETKIRQYAKRQLTWLKRDKDIVWIKLEAANEAITLVNDFVSKRK